MRERSGGASIAEGEHAEGEVIFDEADLEALGEAGEEGDIVEEWAAEPDVILDGADDDEAVAGEEVITAEEAAWRLLQKRQRVLYGVRLGAPAAAASGGAMSAADSEFVASERAKGMGRDEEEMPESDEVDVGKPIDYVWREKYKPRKPR